MGEKGDLVEEDDGRLGETLSDRLLLLATAFRLASEDLRGMRGREGAAGDGCPWLSCFWLAAYDSAGDCGRGTSAAVFTESE